MENNNFIHDIINEEIERANRAVNTVKILTEEEKAEQATLRREYIDSYKRSLEAQLSNTSILYPDGTKKKVTKKH